MGERPPNRARRAKKKGEIRMIPATNAINPGTSQITPPPFAEAPEIENMTNPMNKSDHPGNE